jgi:hypothetical protein
MPDQCHHHHRLHNHLGQGFQKEKLLHNPRFLELQKVEVMCSYVVIPHQQDKVSKLMRHHRHQRIPRSVFPHRHQKQLDQKREKFRLMTSRHFHQMM